MKIESLPTPAIEKDVGGRGARDGAQAEKAGSAFGEAVKQAGEKATPKGAVRGEAGTNETDAEDARLAGSDEGEKVDAAPEAPPKGDSLQSLLLLMSAAPAGAAAPDETRDPDGAGLETTAPSLGEPGEEGGDVPTERLPRVRVLRTETHFEPRVDGALGEDPASSAPAAPAGSIPSGTDVVERLAQDLARTVATPPVGAGRETTVSQSAGPTAKAQQATQASANDDPAPAPVRFDEAVARLGQPAAAARSETGARQDGREGARRGFERPDAASATTSASARAETRLDALSTSSVETSGSDGPLPSGFSGLASQVAARIADALGSPSSTGSDRGSPFAAPGSDGHLRLRAGGAALKTLTIQLQPEHLGTLDVSMRLREGKLAIELTASKPEAAAALTQDRETLRKVLESAGFSLDEAAVTVTTRESATARVADTGSSSQTGGGEGGSGSSGDLSRQDGRAPDRERDRSASSQREGDTSRAANATSSSRASGQTYL